MPISQNQAIKIVGNNGGGAVHSGYGPYPIGNVRVFEIWVKAEGQYCTRFVTEIEGETPQYFSDFSEASEYFNKQFVEGQSGSTEIQIRKIKLYVAALVFVVTVFAFLYLVLTGSASDTVVVVTLLGVVVSGGALFFGRWIPAG